MKVGEVMYEFDAFEAGWLMGCGMIPPELEKAFVEGSMTFSMGAVKCDTPQGEKYANPGDLVAVIGNRLTVITKDRAQRLRRLESV